MNLIIFFMMFLPLLISIPLFLAKCSPKMSKLISLATSGASLILSIIVWMNFNNQEAGFQFLIEREWIKDLGINFILGIDGLSLSLILLTTVLTFITIVYMDVKEKKVKTFLSLILFLETTLIGVFISLDFFLFYLFWEAVLIPMYFLIIEWGGENRRYAGIKFFIYTHVGSFLILCGILGMYFFNAQESGVYTLSMIEYINNNNFSLYFQLIVFPMMFIGFAFKLPLVPFHTWLPDAHVQAPTGGSILLAGVMLKMGGYGLIRVGFTMFPDALDWYAYLIGIVGVVSMIYGAFLALAQDDLKKMIAYSSVSHMGSVVLGLAALNSKGFDGAGYQLFAHGIISAMMFMVCGIVQHSFHTRKISELGGISAKVPKLSAFVVFSFMASLGLPALAGFIAEINIFMGAYAAYKTLTMIAIASLIITAAYYLWAIERAFMGPINPDLADKSFKDVTWNEKLALSMLTALIIYFGVLPSSLMDMLHFSNLNILARIGGLN